MTICRRTSGWHSNPAAEQLDNDSTEGISQPFIAERGSETGTKDRLLPAKSSLAQDLQDPIWPIRLNVVGANPNCFLDIKVRVGTFQAIDKG